MILRSDTSPRTELLFVCHGNICRSVAAEMVMRQLIDLSDLNSRFSAASAAVSAEELGNDIYPPMKQALRRAGIPFERHYARQINRTDYEHFDHIIAMDNSNMRRLRSVFGGDPQQKLSLLLTWAGRPGREIDDPWYTCDFDGSLRQIQIGCRGLLDELLRQRG